jgi:subtilase family serine protease
VGVGVRLRSYARWSTGRRQVVATVTDADRPDLAVGLVTTRDSRDRTVAEGAGMLPYVVELTATVANLGGSTAGETSTRFWLRGSNVDRELRVVNTPELLPGDEIQVTALWDLREGSGDYTVTVTADAFGQIDEARLDNNTATAHVTVRGTRVELA